MGVAVKKKSDDKLFITQKYCVRILFGDLDTYLDKQSTSARARPFNYQKLGAKYYQKEHAKPIFSKLQILTVQGLFKYHCISKFSRSSNLAVLIHCINLLTYQSETLVI